MISSEQEKRDIKQHKLLARRRYQWSTHQAPAGVMVLAMTPKGEASAKLVDPGAFDVWKFRALIKTMVRELETVG